MARTQPRFVDSLTGLCIATTVGVTKLAVAAFTLIWTHSVEKIEWQEDWIVGEGRLLLAEARIKGSGAGMEPGDGATLRGGWWTWRPDRSVGELVLADSGAAGRWRLCTRMDGCRPLADPVHAPYRLSSCP